MLRTKARRSSSLRLLTDRDRDEVLAICDRDAVANVFVGSRVRSAGLDSSRLGAQVWGYADAGQLVSLCYSGANLVPVAATPAALAAFAERARLQGRRCSSIVGPATAVGELWGMLAPYWGRPREIRSAQPVTARAIAKRAISVAVDAFSVRLIAFYPLQIYLGPATPWASESRLDNKLATRQ